MKNYLLLLVIIGCGSQSVNNQMVNSFEATPTKVPLKPGIIDEASGMANCRTVANSLWVVQDSGNPPELALLNYNGSVAGKMSLPEVQNRDWEDLASGQIDGQNYLFIADIGDNDAKHELSYIYKLPEPKSLGERISKIDRITFKYPDGKRDAETLLFDPITKDLLIVSKREASVRVYRLAYPQATNATLTAELVATLPYTFITAGSVSSDGSELILKNYSTVYYWPRNASQTVGEALKNKAAQLPYIVEPQGESVCFDKTNAGYFTLSERANAPQVSLNFYQRK